MSNRKDAAKIAIGKALMDIDDVPPAALCQSKHERLCDVVSDLESIRDEIEHEQQQQFEDGLKQERDRQ